MSALSPRTRTTTSARCAAATAAGISTGPSPSTGQPGTYAGVRIAMQITPIPSSTVSTSSGVPVKCPGAQQIASGCRPAGRSRRYACAGRQRQQTAVVLQQHHRLLRDLQGQRAEVVAQNQPARQRLIGVGALEEAEPRSSAADTRDRRVDQRPGTAPSSTSAARWSRVGVADHIHVQAGQDAQPRRILQIGGHAVGDQLADRLIVAHHHARPLPLIAQNRCAR